jgi:hypothetical protein
MLTHDFDCARAGAASLRMILIVLKMEQQSYGTNKGELFIRYRTRAAL